MTGLEWQACTDPRLMFEALRRRGGVSERKYRLFAAAYGRWRSNLVGESGEQMLDEVRVMEHLAEGGRLPRGMRMTQAEERIFFHKDGAQSALLSIEFAFAQDRGGGEDARVQANLLRDLFGNPFRSVRINYRWRTSDVIDLARAIDEDRAFERMPILADALMDAGCEDERVISHCFSGEGHVKGCWALDLLLRPDTPPERSDRGH